MLKESSNNNNKKNILRNYKYWKRKDDLQRRFLFITKSRWAPKTRFKWYQFIWSYL